MLPAMNTPVRSFDLPPRPPSAADFNAYAKCLMLGRGDKLNAMTQAEVMLGAVSRPAAVLKAAVTAGTTTDTDWAAGLVDYQVMQQQFLDTLRHGGVFDRMLADMLGVPLRSRVVANSTVLVGDAPAEAAPKPIRQLSLSAQAIDIAKVTSILVLSRELVEFERQCRHGLPGQ